MPHQIVVIPVHILTMLDLNDHVMHDHTSHHGVPKDLLNLELRWTSHNSKLGLQYLKCSLNILHSSCSSIVNVLFFLTRGADKGLHKCSPLQIDTITKVVSFIIGPAVVYKLHIQHLSVG
jgi:hypothetical protein